MTPKLKVGDTLVITKEIADAKRNCKKWKNDAKEDIGRSVRIESVSNYGSFPYYTTNKFYFEIEMLDKILNKSITPLNMSLADSIKNLARREPAKTYVKLGVTDSDGKLTLEGQTAFIQHQFEANADEKSDFYAQCKAVLAEEEKKK